MEINNRLVLQWLSYNNSNVTNGTNVTRNLPTSFNNKCICIIGSITNTPLNYSRYNPAYVIYNKSQITLVYWTSTETNIAVQNLKLSCVVIGY